MSKIKVKTGFFLAKHKTRRDIRTGGPLYGQFLISEKKIYTATGWEQVTEQVIPEVVEKPEVAAPETATTDVSEKAKPGRKPVKQTDDV